MGDGPLGPPSSATSALSATVAEGDGDVTLLVELIDGGATGVLVDGETVAGTATA